MPYIDYINSWYSQFKTLMNNVQSINDKQYTKNIKNIFKKYKINIQHVINS